MKRVLLVFLLGAVCAPAMAMARSNHSGWHGAAPVKRLGKAKIRIAGYPRP